MIPMARRNRLRIQAAVVAGRMRPRLRRTGARRMSLKVTSIALFAAADKDDAVFRRAVPARLNGSGGTELACLCLRQGAQHERDCQRHDRPAHHKTMVIQDKSMRVHAVLLPVQCAMPIGMQARMRAIRIDRRVATGKSGRL